MSSGGRSGGGQVPLQQCASAAPGDDFNMSSPFYKTSFNYPWGQKTSTCNISNMAMLAQVNISTDITQNNTSTVGNSFVVTDNCQTDCDTFKFDNNQVEQTNAINMTNVQRAFVTNSAQQQLMLQVLQQASSVSKGIPVLSQETQSTNIINAYMRASINMTTNISQTCDVNETNTIYIDSGAASNVEIENNIFEQTNESTTQCNQFAVNRNVSMQSLTAQLDQFASAEAVGFTLLVIIVIVIAMVLFFLLPEAGIIYMFTKSPKSGVAASGVLMILVSALWFTFWATIKKKVTPWYGCSVGLENSSCFSSYTPAGDWVDYATSDKAQKACKKMGLKKCTALDWKFAGDGDNTGQAKFYSGGPHNPALTCTDITGGGDTDASNTVISIRPCAFLNMDSLKDGEKPGNDVVADVVLDVLTGNLWVKMPPGYDACKVPPVDDPIWTSTNWSFVAPTSLEAGNAPNAFLAVDDSVACSPTQCSGSCKFKQIKKKSDKSKVYVYISPNQQIDLDVGDARWDFGSGTYEQWFAKSYDSLPDYRWQFGNAVGSSKMYDNISEDDYFLMVFPVGPNDSQDPTTWPAADTSGDNSQIFEQYAFGSQYYLYPATKSGDAWVPYTGFAPNAVDPAPPPPTNILSGYGTFPEVKAYVSTMFQFETRETFWLWFGFSFLGAGFILLVASAFMKGSYNGPQLPNQSDPVGLQEAQSSVISPDGTLPATGAPSQFDKSFDASG